MRRERIEIQCRTGRDWEKRKNCPCVPFIFKAVGCVQMPDLIEKMIRKNIWAFIGHLMCFLYNTHVKRYMEIVTQFWYELRAKALRALLCPQAYPRRVDAVRRFISGMSVRGSVRRVSSFAEHLFTSGILFKSLSYILLSLWGTTPVLVEGT